MNQVVLVSGAAGGIGSATARLLAARGAHVVLADLDAAALEAVAGGIGTSATTALLDVTDPAACAAVVEQVVATHGRLDIVWANAGISAYGPAELLDPAAWRRVIDVNLVGAYNLVNAGAGGGPRRRDRAAEEPGHPPARRVAAARPAPAPPDAGALGERPAGRARGARALSREPTLKPG